MLRDALRLMEERERRLAALDAALQRGLSDCEAGQISPAADTFDSLEARYVRLSEDCAKP